MLISNLKASESDLEYMYRWVLSGCFDDIQDIIFEELFRGARYGHRSHGYIESFFYTFKEMNKNYMTFNNNYAKFTNGPIRGYEELLDIYCFDDLGEFDVYYIEAITAICTSCSEIDPSFVIYFKNIIRTSNNREKIIKLIKSLHNIEYDNRDQISIFNRCNEHEEPMEVKINKRLPFRFAKYKISVDRQASMFEFECYNNGILIENGYAVEILKDYTLDISPQQVNNYYTNELFRDFNQNAGKFA